MKHAIKLISCACGCGEKIPSRDKRGRERSYVNRHHGRINVDKRFWAKVNKGGPDDCWEWTGCKVGGYGRLKIDGSPIGSHVIAWMFAHGPVPNGLCVLHKCDNPPCCNPNHLFLGTHAENMLDCAKKGRWRNQSAKLTEKQVIMIRKRYAEGGITHQRLAGQYGMCKDHIGCIIRRKCWRHI